MAPSAKKAVKKKAAPRSTKASLAVVTHRPKPKIAVWKFASCDGCQLSLLDCENELLDVVGEVEIAYFLEATRNVVKGPYDISLVEGSITTEHDVHRIRKIRQQSKVLIAIGACATAGGIQALRNFADVDDFIRAVYPRPDYISTLRTSTPIQEHVTVDFELRGCPINKHQLLEVLNAFLNHRSPNIPQHSQCIECKQHGTVCVMVSKGIPCLGPVTQAGCGNLCPSTDRGCYGCFGPADPANGVALGKQLEKLGMSTKEIQDLFRTYNANASGFRRASEAYESVKTK